MDFDLRRPGETERMPALRQAVTGIELAMLTTVDKEARPRTRPVVLLVGERDGELWLLTSAASPPGDLEPGSAVSVAHTTLVRWVSISGTAECVDDPARLRELWTVGCATWFPRGPADPALRLLRVSVSVVETWDVLSGRRTRLEIRDLGCREALAREISEAAGPGELGDLSAPSDAAQGAPWAREQSGRLLSSLERVSARSGARRH